MVILADTLDVEPTASGCVVVDDRRLAVVDVRRDPVAATWEIQARA